MSDEQSGEGSAHKERREAFLRSIRVRSPIMAALYEAARRLVADPGFPARAALIAHAVRELRNRLPDAFGIPGGRVDHSRMLGDIRPLWEPVRNVLGGPSSMEDEIAIPVEAARKLTSLLDEDAGIEGRVKRRFIQMCAAVSGESVHWAGNALLAAQWSKIRAEKIAHSSSDEDADALAVEAFQALEDIILRIFEYAAPRERRIDDRAIGATKDTVEADLRELVTLHDVDVYFSRLSKPELFEPLKKNAQFSSPGDSLNYWPQAAYLLTIAPSRPKQVAATLKDVNPTSPGVVRQLLEIAMALPDAKFTDVLAKSKWLRSKPSFIFLDPMIKAMRRLADLGAKDVLFSKAAYILAVKEEAVKRPLSIYDRPSAVPMIDSSSFADALRHISDILRPVAPMRTLDFFRSLLDRVIAIIGYDYEHGGFWYANLLDRDARRYNVLSEVTGELARVAIEVGREAADEVITYFDGLHDNASLYRRFSAAVCAACGSPEDAARRIADLAQWTYGAENRALLERGFRLLSEEQRTQILDRVFEQQRARVTPNLTEQGATADDVERIVSRFVAQIIGSAVDAAPEPYGSTLASVAREESAPAVEQAPDLQSFERLGVGGVGHMLRRWIPSGSADFPTPYGIGGALRLYVEQNGSEWLSFTGGFAGIPDYFLPWAVNGLDGYLRTTAAFNPSAVLIADEALRRADTLTRGGSEHDIATAEHIAQNAGTLLVEHAKKATSVDDLATLLNSVEFLKAMPEGKSASTRSPWTASSDGLADPRTNAIHILGHMIIVVHNSGLDAEQVRASIDGVSLTNNWLQRAALGEVFRSASIKFPDDAARWATQIFFSGDEEANRAAWAGYIAWAQPNVTTHDLLRSAYSAALADIAAAAEPSSTDGMKTVRNRTLWHVWVFLANEVEILDDASSLASQMLSTVEDDDLNELLGEIAQSLAYETSQDAGRRDRVYERAMQLWERVEKLVHDGGRSPKALQSVALWVAAPLPATWRFEKAESLSSRDENVRHNSWQLVQAVVELRTTDLLRALKVVDQLLQPAHAEVLTAVQQYAYPLLTEGSVGTADERHIAQHINSLLVNNHRPSLLD